MEEKDHNLNQDITTVQIRGMILTIDPEQTDSNHLEGDRSPLIVIDHGHNQGTKHIHQ